MRYGVTGSRLASARLPGGRIIQDVISGLGDVTEFTTGAQFGVDTVAFLAALEAFPEAVHRACVPVGLLHNQGVPLELQERIAREPSPAKRTLFAGGVTYASGRWSIIFHLCPPEKKLGPWLYHARNGSILDYSDVLLAFPRSSAEEVRSGTWSCVREARRRGITIWVFPLDGSSVWREDRRAT